MYVFYVSIFLILIPKFLLLVYRYDWLLYIDLVFCNLTKPAYLFRLLLLLLFLASLEISSQMIVSMQRQIYFLKI